jgi:NADH-quinone oxidoreductase subunit J
MEALTFYIMACITVVSAVLVVFMSRPLHNVLFMIMTMLGLAGLFLLLRAEFVAMVQVIVYAGAVMVLFLFVVMLLNLNRLGESDQKKSVRGWAGALVGFGIFAVMMTAFKYLEAGPAPKPEALITPTNTTALAKELFTTYLLPFEIASVLLLAAMIGAVLLIGRRPHGE